MMKNNKQDELAEALLEWAKEDADNRSVMLIAGDEENIRKTYFGSGSDLVESLVRAMLDDEELYTLFATAMLLYRNNKENDDDEAETNND